MPAPTLTSRVPSRPARPPRGGRLTRWVLAALGVAGIAGFGWFNFRAERDPLSQMTVAESRLVRAADDVVIEHANPATRPELLFRVTLDHAPVGRRLWLACDWFDPDGRIAHQTHYQSLRIDSDVWTTQAPFALPSDAPHGTWIVQMKHDGRLLAKQTFLVNDKPAPPAAPKPVPVAVSPPARPVPPAPVKKPDPPVSPTPVSKPDTPVPPVVTPPPAKPQPPVAVSPPSKPSPTVEPPPAEETKEPAESVKSGSTKKSTKWYRRKKGK